MKILILTILYFTLIYSTVSANDDWDTTDKTLLTSLIILKAIDCMQTQYIFNHPNEYHELNPIIIEGVKNHGERFVPVYFIATTLLEVFIADMLPSKYRKIGLSFLMGASVATVQWNYRMGIRLTF